MIEMHRVLGAPLARRPQVIHITEHIGQRHCRIQHTGVTAGIHTRNIATPAVQIADDVAHIFIRSDNFDAHNRLKQFRAGFCSAFAESRARRYFKGHNRRIDVMAIAIIQRHLHIGHREACQHAGIRSAHQALLDTGDKFARHIAANDG